jgi:hypothetical protein
VASHRSGEDIKDFSSLPYDDASFLKVEAFLSQSEIALIEKGARMPRSYIKRNWDVKHPVQVAFPEFSLIRSYVKIFCARAISSAKRGDTRQVIADLETSFGLARIPGNENMMISALVQVACEAITYRTIEHCVAVNPAIAQELNRNWSNEHDLKLFGKVLRNEARIMCTEVESFNPDSNDLTVLFFGLMSGEQPELAEYEAMVGQVFKSASSIQQARAALSAQVLGHMSKLIERSESSKSHLEASDIAKSMHEALVTKKEPTQFINLLLTDVYSKFPTAIARANAKRSMNRALMLAVEFKQKNGRFPRDLTEINFTELDPFSMKPFGYKVVGDELRIYSIGIDRIDNGGVQSNEAEGEPRQFDDVVIFPKALPARKVDA